MKKQKIFVIGSYGSSNIGDDAILEMIKNQLGNDFKIIPAIPHLPYRFISIPFRLKTIWNLIKSDFVIFGGGGLLTDDDTIKAIKIWQNTINWAKFFGKKIFMYSNSIGPFNSKKSQELAKKTIGKIDFLTVRDDISLENLKKLGFEGKCFTDPVFAFDTKFLDDLQDFEEKNFSKKKYIGVSLRNTKKYFNHIFFEKFLEKKEKEGFEILLIAMENSDEILFEKFYLSKNKNRFLVKPKNFKDLLGVLKKCDLLIGMRLHFLIGSSLVGKKMLAISYSSKVFGIMKQIGINSIENFFEKNSQEFLEKLNLPRIDQNNFEDNFENDIIEKKFEFPKNIENQIEKVKKLNEEFKNFVENIKNKSN